MPNPYINKIIYGGNTLIDLTGDTISQSDVINSKTFHSASGAVLTGTCTYDADTSDATATASEILASKTGYVAGAKVTGTMPNRGAVTLTIDNIDDELAITNGYHDGSGVAKLDATEKAKIVPNVIKSGVQLLGVTGTYAGETQPTQTKTVTPSATAQTVLPDAGYLLSQVNVNAVPYTETDNPQGGKTVTIL